MPDIFDVDAPDPDEFRPQPFADGARPGWYACNDGMVADDRRFTRAKDCAAAIKEGRIGLPQDRETSKPRYLSHTGWLTEDESARRAKIEHRIDTGEFKVNANGQVVCSFCGGNCGQCGNTGLTDVNGASMDAMIEGLYGPSELDVQLKRLGVAIRKSVFEDPWGFVIRLCFSMGVVLFLLVWYNVLVHTLRHIGVLQ